MTKKGGGTSSMTENADLGEVSGEKKSAKPACVCKGIRTCLLCEGSQPRCEQNPHLENVIVQELTFCIGCSKLFRGENVDLINACFEKGNGGCYAHNNEGSVCVEQEKEWGKVLFEGASVYVGNAKIWKNSYSSRWLTNVDHYNRYSRQVELEFSPWVASQSGRRKQDYGPKANFKRKKVKIHQDREMHYLPLYQKEMLSVGMDIIKQGEKDRGRSGGRGDAETLKVEDFIECGILEYDAHRGASLTPHVDDAWLWGENLVSWSLLSTAVMNFTRNVPIEGSTTSRRVRIHVPLPEGCVLWMRGKARHQWMHGIERSDIDDRRISVTFRELSEEFKPSSELCSKQCEEDQHLVCSVSGGCTGLKLARLAHHLYEEETLKQA
eukprot:Nk52_evm7s296 gene=Nk52_evmTU7s296